MGPVIHTFRCTHTCLDTYIHIKLDFLHLSMHRHWGLIPDKFKSSRLELKEDMSFTYNFIMIDYCWINWFKCKCAGILSAHWSSGYMVLCDFSMGSDYWLMHYSLLMAEIALHRVICFQDQQACKLDSQEDSFYWCHARGSHIDWSRS